jgi:hypothetical protein
MSFFDELKLDCRVRRVVQDNYINTGAHEGMKANERTQMNDAQNQSAPIAF